jgi:hypothetical protein
VPDAALDLAQELVNRLALLLADGALAEDVGEDALEGRGWHGGGGGGWRFGGLLCVKQKRGSLQVSVRSICPEPCLPVMTQ